MKTRDQIYARDAGALLRDITMYRVLTEAQLLRLHPGRDEKTKNLLSYLVRQNRAWLVDGYYCAAADSLENVDRGLTAAVWVLVDFIKDVEYHAAGDYPAKIIFFAGGEIYEIVEAVRGKEILLSRVLADSGGQASRYLVIVEEPEQISEIDIPNVSGYCTVSDEGEVRYYRKEGAGP